MFSISYLSQSCSTYLTEDMSLQTGKLVNVTQSSHDIMFNNEWHGEKRNTSCRAGSRDGHGLGGVE